MESYFNRGLVCSHITLIWEDIIDHINVTKKRTKSFIFDLLLRNLIMTALGFGLRGISSSVSLSCLLGPTLCMISISSSLIPTPSVSCATWMTFSSKFLSGSSTSPPENPHIFFGEYCSFRPAYSQVSTISPRRDFSTCLRLQFGL